LFDLLNFESSLDLGFTPAPDKIEPRLWIHRFAIWKGLGHSPVQNITFKKGLNIIWKSSDNPFSTNVLVDSGLTSVVRLLRYSLGEEHFDNSAQENVIRKRYKNGAVGIEVFVDGKMISVIRGFSSPERTLVSFDTNLEDLWREDALAAPHLTGIEPFLEEMEKAIKPLLPKYCDIEAKDLWEASYGYIARDRESGFFDVVKGHSKKMQSQSADINRKELIQNICALLGFENQHNLHYAQRDQTKITPSNSIDPRIEPQVILGIINNRNVPEPCKHSLKVLKDFIERQLFIFDLKLNRKKEDLEKLNDELGHASEKRTRSQVKQDTLNNEKRNSQKIIKTIEKDLQLLSDQLIAIEGECPACSTSMCDVLARGCL